MSTLEPQGVPSGGSDLSSDDSPTGNDGTAGADTDAGIIKDDPQSGGSEVPPDDEPLTDDDALSDNDSVTTGEPN
jgi:hypothetical protein